MKKKESTSSLSRRDFVKRTVQGIAGVGVGLLASTNFAHAAGSGKIRVGMVGCGGRGTGAANDALRADPAVEIYAMADLFGDRLEHSRKTLVNEVGDRVNVPESRRFTGFDGYLEVMASGVDYVILTTPPGFRPLHLQAAVERNLHVFMEKPVAVDSAGVRAVIRAGEAAREKNLSLVAGTQYRRQPSFVDAVKMIHDGGIGELVAGQEYYMTGPIWLRDVKPEMSELEAQCLNWYYYTWLSGDHIVEQFVHNLDTLNWVFQGHPVRAIANGGRQVRTGSEYGQIYDHFSVEYEYSNGARVQAMCRQMKGTSNRNSNRIIGSKGVAEINPGNSMITSHDGDVLLRINERGNNPYVQEHADLIASIRNNRGVNEARDVAESTLTGILGREAAYTGQNLTWDEVFNAEMDLLPKDFSRKSMPEMEVAEPGVTKLARTFPV